MTPLLAPGLARVLVLILALADSPVGLRNLRNLWRISQLYDKITDARKHPDTLRHPATWEALYKAAWAVEEIRVMLSGSRSYLVAAAVAAVTVAYTLGYIDEKMYQSLLGLLGAGGLAAVRAAISKATPK